MVILLNLRNKFIITFILSLFFMSCNDEKSKIKSNHKVEFSEMKNNPLLKDDDYFTLNLKLKDSAIIDFTIISKEIKNKAKNIVLYAMLKNEEADFHLYQWEVDSSFFKNSYKIPDSLLFKIKTLSFCLVYFDTQILEPEIVDCKSTPFKLSIYKTIPPPHR